MSDENRKTIASRSTGELAHSRPGAGAILDRMAGDAAEARRRRQEAEWRRIGGRELREESGSLRKSSDDSSARGGALRVRFGLHFDGLQPHPPANATGVVTLGPAGLLSVLENRLGLPSPVAHPSEAVFAYRQCLREISAPSRFFHRSFQVDPFNVARTFLDWRTRWYEAGWDGTFPDTAPARLADMAAVEAIARDRVPLCPGERLRRVEAALGERVTQIDCVELHTSPDALPHAWRRVLEALPCESAPGLDPVPSGPEGSDLARVQAVLLSMADGSAGTDHHPPTHPHDSFAARMPVRARTAPRQGKAVEVTTRRRPAAVKQGDQPGTTSRERLRLQGDGSLILVRSASRDLSAEAAAECILHSARHADTLLVAERDGVILDNALERVGLPRCGFRYHTRFRGAAQVLKLCLALMWAPVSPHRMLQFLLHPTGPLPRWVRSRLADAVAASPGVGGPQWRKTFAGIERTLRERDGAGDEDVERQRSGIAFWLDGQRHDPRAGAPIDEVVARTQRASAWAAGRIATADTEAETVLFGVARAQAEALLVELACRRDDGAERIPRLELERMVDEVTTDTPDPATFAEAGHPRATASPGAVTDRWPVVVWWNIAPSPAAVSYPWSRRELAVLREAEARLPEIDDVLRHRSREWLRPVLNAMERLVLVTHEDEGGTHPILTQIESCFDGIEEVKDGIKVQVESALLHGEPTLAPLPIRTRALPLRPLPAPRRWWSLPEDCTLVPGDVESYSSLSKLCDYPHEWVLHYAARLRAGRAAEVSDGPLLYGNLGHRLIEEFFRAHDDWRSVPIHDARAWVRATYPGLVEREGAVLLEPGRGIDRERVGATLERAVDRLLGHLRAAGIEHVVPEASREAPFAEHRLTGVIDLLLTDANGDHAVIDVKWGSRSYRRDLLVENRALQLATYACLQKTLDAARRWPHVAFFILSTGELLANEGSRFPDAVVAPSASDEGIPDLWRRLGVTYRWRWEQLSRRRIEVVTDLTKPDEHSTPPDAGLAAIARGDPYDDFGRLTGWKCFQ